MERERYRIVPDGPGYGVQRYSRTFCDWEFVNDEPFPSKNEAKEWWRELIEEGTEHDWKQDRYLWSHGRMEPGTTHPRL